MMTDDWITGFIPAQIKLAQILLIVSLGIYLGQTGRSNILAKSLAVLAGAVAGLGLSMFAIAGSPLLPFILGTIILVSASGSLAWPKMPTGYVLLAAGGAAVGSAAMPVGGVMPAMLVVLGANLTGTIVCLCALTALALWIHADGRPFWMHIATRILCAWIAAIAIMLLAFDLAV